MKLDYQRLGRYVIFANLLVTVLVIYLATDLVLGEAASKNNAKLFAPVKPVEKAQPRAKSIFRDYSVITADRFLPRPGVAPGEPTGLVPIPGPSSALDRLLKLRGTAVSSEKGMSFAILELLQNGEFRTVRVGDEVAGATVLDIGGDSILVSMENEEITVFLNATEEYNIPSKKSSSGRKSKRPDNRFTGKMPPAMQEYIKRLPPEMQKRWQNATPEQKKKAIKKFMERAGQGQNPRQGSQRSPRDVRRRR